MANSSEMPTPSTTANPHSSPPLPSIPGQNTAAVEMATLPARRRSDEEMSDAPNPVAAAAPHLSLPADEPSSLSQDIAQAQSQSQSAKAGEAPSSAQAETAAPALTRHETEAIGPSTDQPITAPSPDAEPSGGPVITITLLLTSGARHPYKIDEKYLKKRGVQVDAMDPFNVTVYKLKELILRDWRTEWEPAPSAPSSIRLIHFGRMLEDKLMLKDCRFQQESPNVVHMTIKPQEVVDEEDAKTGKGGSRRDADDDVHAGCRCVIL